MIYSERIECWKDNFIWFMDMFHKHKMYPPKSLYLLEVRNAEWTRKQIREFCSFLDFLVKWCWDWTEENPGRFLDFVFKEKGFNILSTAFSSVGRGLGCSIQSTLFIRLGDLSIVPCHRNSYAHDITARLKVENDRIVGVESVNPELMLATFTFDGDALPYCETCVVKSMCNKGCLGSQYEVNGDMFTPIPTVCMMEMAKIRQLVLSMKDIGMLDQIRGMVKQEKKDAIDFLEVN